MSFAVCVTFTIKPEHHSKFLQLVRENAKISLRSEAGCKQFYVCCNEEYHKEVFLYEIYSSPEAFNCHLKTKHYLDFDEKTIHMASSKHVRTYRELV